jgi:hypothetical protein
MRHFVETKPFGTAMVGAVVLGIGYQTGLTDWIALIFLPVVIMVAYWFIIDHEPQ